MKQRHVTFESQHKVVQGALILSERLGVVLVHFIDGGSPHERDSALAEKKKENQAVSRSCGRCIVCIHPGC